MAMFNVLKTVLECPSCLWKGEMEVEFRFGFTNLDPYVVGDKLSTREGEEPLPNGFIGEGYVECPNCHRDFWVNIRVEKGVVKDVTVNRDKPGFIP